MSNEIRDHVVKYLNDKGLIKACLLHKLINYFCSQKSRYAIKKKNLLFSLLISIKERELDVVIIKPYEVRWNIEKLNNLAYIKDGDYFVRVYHKRDCPRLDAFENNNYLFDSRKINYTKKGEVEVILEWLSNIFKKKK